MHVSKRWNAHVLLGLNPSNTSGAPERTRPGRSGTERATVVREGRPPVLAFRGLRRRNGPPIAGPLPIRPLDCFEAGGSDAKLNLLQGSIFTAARHRLRRPRPSLRQSPGRPVARTRYSQWMSGHPRPLTPAARVGPNDSDCTAAPQQAHKGAQYPGRQGHLPGGTRNLLFSLDLYLSWMSPQFPQLARPAGADRPERW